MRPAGHGTSAKGGASARGTPWHESAVDILIMKPLGTDLKLAREKKGKTLVQIAADTKISVRYLQYIEEGRYGELPGGMYNRAFIRSYCDSIGIDPKSILQRYETEILPAAEKLSKSKQEKLPSVSSGFRPHPLVLWSVMLMLSVSGLYLSRKHVAAVFSPYFSSQPMRGVTVATPSEPTATNSGISSTSRPISTPLSTEGPTVTGESQTMPATMDGPSLSAPVQTIHLEFEVMQKCWVSVRSDGTRVLVKELKPGEGHSLDATKDFFLILGNAGGVRLKINGKPLKLLGKPGQIVKVLIDENSLRDLIENTAG